MTFTITVLAPWVLLAICVALTPWFERALTPILFTVAIPGTVAVLCAATAASAIAIAAVLLTSGEPWLRLIGLALLATVVWRLLVLMRHAGRVLASRRANAPFTRAATPGSDVLVIDDPEPDAFAVPTGKGVVVVTAGLCRVLPPDELSAVIRHERAHLRHRHYAWIQLCEFAARVNPLADPITRAVRLAAERHADQAAARGGSRPLLRALARTSLVRSARGRAPDSDALHGNGSDVVQRIRALTEQTRPATPKRGLAALAVATVAAVVIIAGLGDVVEDCVSPEPGEPPSAVFH
ncbi:M56 family metallopeptidase [Gordonia sp. CPCC 205515]|uniref:M56 family metallopeptidase n=1 Tax=Gordonia sp. CPCC 205515 TaxID=3140791 RepID=UPI003AF3A9F6